MIFLLLACNGKDTPAGTTDETPTDSGDSGLVVNSPFTVSEAPTGNLDCYTGEVSNPPEPTATGSVEVDVSVVVQGSEDPIADLQATITGSGEEPLIIDVEEDGSAGTRSLKVCTPLSGAVGLKPSAETNAVVTTVGAKMLGPEDTQWRIPVVTKGQYDSQATQLGAERQQGTGAITGNIRACGPDGLDHIQLSIEEGNGIVTWGYVGDDGWGTGEWTDTTGQFAAVNVQAGPNTITAWMWNGEKHVPIARADISVPAGGMRMVQLRAGKSGELNPPEACLGGGGGGGGDTGE